MQENGRKEKGSSRDARRNSERSVSQPSRAASDGQGAKQENKEKKWDTLVHAGVLFPPEYEAHGVKLLYEGKPVELTEEQVMLLRPCHFVLLGRPALLLIYMAATNYWAHAACVVEPFVNFVLTFLVVFLCRRS